MEENFFFLIIWNNLRLKKKVTINSIIFVIKKENKVNMLKNRDI